MMLKKLQLNDFLSHKNTVIEFTPNSKVLIDGSSGSGKTAIVEAIIWCLFGKGRLDNRSLVRNGQGSGNVDLHIGNDTNKWIIRRSITSGGKQSLSVTHEVEGKVLAVPSTTVKESQEYIEKEILRCSYELFINSVVYPQDSGQNFVKQSAVKRKELLLEIIGAVDFDEYLAKAKNKYALLDREISDLGIRIDTNKEHLKACESRLKSIKEKEGGESIKSMGKNMDKLQDEVEELKGMEETYTKYVSNITDKVNKEAQAREYVKVLKDSLRDKVDVNGHESRIAEIEKAEDEARELPGKIAQEKEKLDLSSKLSQETEHAERLKKEKADLKVDKDDVCPVTNEICPKVSDVYDKRKKLIDDSLDVVQGKIDKLTSQLEKLPQGEADQDFIDIMEKKIAGVAELGIEKATLAAELKGMKDAEAYNADVEKKIEEASKVAGEDHSAEADKAIEELGLVKGSLEEATARLSDLSKRYAVAQTIEGDKKQAEKMMAETNEVISILSKKVENLTKDQKCVKIIKEAFGANGIKVVVIDTILPKLERRVNEILSELSNFKIKLDTQKDNKSNEGKREGLFITIINDNGEEMDFDGYSGGEKLKIVVSISEALAELQKAEFRIIDELFIGLDDESVSQFGEVLMRLQKRFSQVLCISHIQPIKNLFADKITVQKHKGVSECIT